MSYPRAIKPVLQERAAQYPVVTVTGPRQAGKTTVCRAAFAHKPYANLERPDTREFAQADPQGFLAQYPDGAIIDEVQRVPALLSWLQVRVDEHARAGQFVLTGCHNFELMQAITQSLAGRTALLHLLPMSVNELQAAGLCLGSAELMLRGGYPRIHAQGLDPTVALADYFATYVERDLRQLAELRNLDVFRRFVRLAAGRVGQLLNLHSLAADVGVSAPTAKAWMSLLEASYIVRLLPPWHANLGKRLIKAPKLYFCDGGLAAWLIGLTDAAQLATHPLRGALFENLVVMEFIKHALNQGRTPRLHFYRDSQGLEVDLLVEDGLAPGEIGLVEIKSGQTYHGGLAQPMHKLSALLGAQVARRMVVYGGADHFTREGVEVVGLPGIGP
ncbi:ATP-binding protein [Ideonella sp. DXS22W]|uniref:ATP-binding protein n=1 Tax=Pseudaquabacterium inlustre TaxID=2984192 RepID=A0ABU9CHZ8_9BURK